MPKGIYLRSEFSKHKNNQGNPVENFWKRVDKNGPVHPVHGQCWQWIGYRIITKKGRTYGHYRGIYAHRYSYEITAGEIPVGLFVLHKCDNQACVNPSHLFLGTAQDNMDDKTRKGRQGDSGTKTPPHGDLNGRAKLTRGQVLFARKMTKQGWSARKILVRLKTTVTLGALKDAISGNTWRTL